MASSRSLLPFMLLALIVLSHVAEINGYPVRPSKNNVCNKKCAKRCSRTHHKKPCVYFCLKCCEVCRCVPTGFYGNKHECACYNNWKTKEGRPKCP